mgnify:CR=1 FL=1
MTRVERNVYIGLEQFCTDSFKDQFDYRNCAKISTFNQLISQFRILGFQLKRYKMIMCYNMEYPDENR